MMTTSNKQNVGIESARGGVYAFFAGLLLNPPTPELLVGILSEQGASAFEALFPKHPAIARFRELIEDYRRGGWQAEDFFLDYEAMFRVPGDAYIHPFESVYRDGNYSSGNTKSALVWGPCAREVAKLYEAEGLALREGFTELPDHLGVELEFMAFLCRKIAKTLDKGDQKGAAAFYSKQHAFMGEHLLSWSCECLVKMGEKASTPFYRHLASLLRSFLEDERSC